MHELISFEVRESNRLELSKVTITEVKKGIQIEKPVGIPYKTHDIYACFRDTGTNALYEVVLREEWIKCRTDQVKRSEVYKTHDVVSKSNINLGGLDKDEQLTFLTSLNHINCADPAWFNDEPSRHFLSKLLMLTKNLQKIDVPVNVDYRSLLTPRYSVWLDELEVETLGKGKDSTIEIYPPRIQRDDSPASPITFHNAAFLFTVCLVGYGIMTPAI